MPPLLKPSTTVRLGSTAQVACAASTSSSTLTGAGAPLHEDALSAAADG
jgi:hypothetical protein